MSSPVGAPVVAPPDHVFTTFIRATQEAVWRAITESEFTLQYYFASTVESAFEAGSRIEYRIDGNLAIEGEVLESDPPRRLAMSFHATWDESVAADTPSWMAWELAPAGPGVTKVTVVHGGFTIANATYQQVTGGVPFILAGLKTLLETGQPLPAG